MEEGLDYEFKIENDAYIIKIQSNSSDKLLFTLKKNDDNELIHYKKELNLEELIETFAFDKNNYSNIAKIFKFIKRSSEKNRIKIKIEKDKAKFILIKENDELENEEYPLDLLQCAVDDQDLNIIVKELKEINEKIKDMTEKQIEKLKEENKKSNEEIIKIKKENQELKEEIIKLKKNEKNEIDIMVKVDKDEDINKNINFLGVKFMNKENNNNNNDNFNELIDVYINNKKLEQFQKFFFPEQKGAYRIKLVFKKLITDCSYMFADCKNIININFKNFNSIEVKSMKYMFTGCVNIEKIDLSSLDTKNVTDMEGLFGELNNISKEELYLYDADKFNNLYKKTYDGCLKLKKIILCETENVTNMAHMFSGCKELKKLDFSSFYTKNVTDMTAMFFNCSGLKELNLSFFDTENVINMSFIFHGCYNLIKIDLSIFNTRNVTNMFSMFRNCRELKELNLFSFNTNNVKSMASMFYSCSNLSNLDLSKFDTKNVTNMSHMFSSCSKLSVSGYISFDTTNLQNAKCIFSGCGNLLEYNYEYISKLDIFSTNFKKFEKKELGLP